MNLKKLTSWLLAAVMVVSLMPMAAFAENIPADSGSDTSYEEQLDEKETEAASSEEDQPDEATAAELVQAKIDALPAAEDLADITAEEAAELNSTVTAISLEIDALTEEEKATLVMDKIIAVAGFLATWTAPVEGENNTPASPYTAIYLGDRYIDATSNTTTSHSVYVGDRFDMSFAMETSEDEYEVPLKFISGLTVAVTDSNGDAVTDAFTFSPSGDYSTLTENDKYISITALKAGSYNVTITAANAPAVVVQLQVNSGMRMQKATLYEEYFDYYDRSDISQIAGITEYFAFKENGSFKQYDSITVKSVTDSNGAAVTGSPLTVSKYSSNYEVWGIDTDGTLTPGETYSVVLALTKGETTVEHTVPYVCNEVTVKYRLTENDQVKVDWTEIADQDGMVSDTERYIILDYSKNAVLEVETYCNGVKLGKENDGVGVGDASQGHKNAYIKDKYGNRGDNGQGSTNWDAQFIDENGLITVMPGERNGSTFIGFSIYPASGAPVVDFAIGLTVTGYTLAPTPNTSPYLNAKIIPATDKNAAVEVCATTAATLDAAYTAKGFYISDGKVYLNAKDSADNLFDITVDGKDYAVVFVKETAESAEMDARAITLTNAAPTVIDGLEIGYNFVNYDNVTDTGWQTESFGGQFKLIKTGEQSYTYYPVYIVNADNSGIIDIEDSAQVKLLSGSVNWVAVEKVDLTVGGKTAKAFRLRIAPPDGSTTVVPTMYAKASAALFTADNTEEFEMSIYSLDTFGNDGLNSVYYKNIFWKYGVSEPVHDFLDEKWDSPRTAVAVERTFDEIDGTEPFVDIVLTKGSGSPLYVENLLYDEIDASTLEVLTKTESRLDIKYSAVDSKGKNCIGITIALKDDADTTTDISEEFKLRFKSKDPNLANFDNYVYGYVLICKDPEIVEEAETVSNADQLLVAYKTMTTGTITLAEGTYAFDETFVHNRNNIKLVGADGANVVFKLADSSNLDPVITVSGKTEDGTIKNITVDGENKRIGVYGSPDVGATMSLDGVKIINCTTGVINKTTAGSTAIDNCVFENNTVAVKSHMDAPDVTNSTFKNNGTAVYVEKFTFSVPVIRNCTFTDNDIDLTTESESTLTDLRQNFFGTTSGSSTVMKSVPDITVAGSGNKDIVYYVPYYTTAAKTVLATTTVGAQVETAAARAAGTTYVLPVDLVINPASTMQSGIFNEIAAMAEAGIAVEIPVTSEDGDVKWQFSKETFAAKENFDFATDTTDIAVSDSLTSGGAATVETKLGEASLYQEVNFAHEGYLPGAARVTVDGVYAADAADKALYLYHVDGDKLVLVEDADVTVVADSTAQKNYYSFTSDHCSEYIISTKIVVEESGDNTGDGGTGDEGTAGGEGEGEAEGTTGGSSSSSSDKKDDDKKDETPAPTATPAAPAQSAAQAAPTVNDFVSALDVEEKLEASAAGEAVIDLAGKELVSAKAFEVLAENPDKSLVFKADGFKWTFAAEDITDANAISGTTFKPEISLDSPNVDEIKALVGDAAENFAHIYFQHHGKLPGKAKVEVFVGKTDAGVTKHVYHYLPERSGFEYMGTTVITQDGWAAFEIYGCSDYILSDVMLDTSLVLEAETEAPAPETNTDDTETEIVPEAPAENGGVGALPIIIVIAVIALAVIFFILRKKGEKE